MGIVLGNIQSATFTPKGGEPVSLDVASCVMTEESYGKPSPNVMAAWRSYQESKEAGDRLAAKASVPQGLSDWDGPYDPSGNIRSILKQLDDPEYQRRELERWMDQLKAMEEIVENKIRSLYPPKAPDGVNFWEPDGDRWRKRIDKRRDRRNARKRRAKR